MGSRGVFLLRAAGDRLGGELGERLALLVEGDAAGANGDAVSAGDGDVAGLNDAAADVRVGGQGLLLGGDDGAVRGDGLGGDADLLDVGGAVALAVVDHGGGVGGVGPRVHRCGHVEALGGGGLGCLDGGGDADARGDDAGGGGQGGDAAKVHWWFSLSEVQAGSVAVPVLMSTTVPEVEGLSSVCGLRVSPRLLSCASRLHGANFLSSCWLPYWGLAGAFGSGAGATSWNWSAVAGSTVRVPSSTVSSSVLKS